MGLILDLQRKSPTEANDLLQRLRSDSSSSVLGNLNTPSSTILTPFTQLPSIASATTASADTSFELDRPLGSRYHHPGTEKLLNLPLSLALSAIEHGIDRFFLCVGTMFPVFERPEGERLKHEIIEPMKVFGTRYITAMSNSHDRAARTAGFSEACGMAAVGLQYNQSTLPALPAAPDFDGTEYQETLFALSKHFLDQAIDKDFLLPEREVQEPSSWIDVEDAIQDMMARVTLTKAKMLRMLISQRTSKPQTLRELDDDLTQWHSNLPDFMRLQNLTDQSQVTEDHRRILFYMHLFYLSAILLKARGVLANEVISSAPYDSFEGRRAIENGLNAAGSLARLLNLLLDQRSIFKKCWLCIFSAYMAFTCLAYSATKSMMVGQERGDLELAGRCLAVMSFCGSEDPIAYQFATKSNNILTSLQTYRAGMQVDPAGPPLLNDCLFIPTSGNSAIHGLSNDLLRTLCHPFTKFPELSESQTLTSAEEVSLGAHLNWASQVDAPFDRVNISMVRALDLATFEAYI
ncbi:MAG: hypothetical protein M1820_003222 [Bogoriella megaspora]|nr:MAG: hypothetical protein M1820_003222 [Bogoriella megaspora]